MKKHHDIRDLKITADKLKIYIDHKFYEFGLAQVSDKLKAANDIERNTFIISRSGYGIHWPLIDEDISIDGLLKQKIRSKKKLAL